MTRTPTQRDAFARRAPSGGWERHRLTRTVVSPTIGREHATDPFDALVASPRGRGHDRARCVNAEIHLPLMCKLSL